MKNLVIYAASILAVALVACESGKTKTAELKTMNDSVSYSYGIQIAESIKESQIKDINSEILAQAIIEAMGEKPQLTMEDVEGVLTRKNEQLEKERMQSGIDFLEVNKAKEGVITTASGLQYRVITSGAGKTPTAISNVTVHYTGKLVDGTVFDSSVERGQPTTFPVNGVISGWTEALQLMKEGDKWELVIPSELAYGKRGAGGVIPPNSVLIFEVELISVND